VQAFKAAYLRIYQKFGIWIVLTCCGNRFCRNNPIRDAIVLGRTLENGETHSYTLVEAEQVINALIDRVDCQLMMALAFFAGLRKGEIQGLQWGDYDGEQLHIKRAFGRGQLGTPKTRKSVRTVPVIAPLRTLLGVWPKEQRWWGWAVGLPIRTGYGCES
jgi:integrase